MYVFVQYTFLPQPEYSRKKAKRLRKFNPRNDKIIIDAGAFALDESSIIFAKNRHAYRQSLRSDHSFIYCKQKSELIYNENGRKNSFVNGGSLAVFKKKTKTEAISFFLRQFKC